MSSLYLALPLLLVLYFQTREVVGSPESALGVHSMATGLYDTCWWACIDWIPTGGTSLVRGSVRARALHCHLPTQRWRCTAATQLQCHSLP